jgi:hypothetical protein
VGCFLSQKTVCECQISLVAVKKAFSLRFRTIITTIAIITPSLITYGMLLLTIFYIFSMIGMEIFGDVIKTQTFVNADSYNCYNSRLKDSDFTRLIIFNKKKSENFIDFLKTTDV